MRTGSDKARSPEKRATRRQTELEERSGDALRELPRFDGLRRASPSHPWLTRRRGRSTASLEWHQVSTDPDEQELRGQPREAFPKELKRREETLTCGGRRPAWLAGCEDAFAHATCVVSIGRLAAQTVEAFGQDSYSTQRARV